MKDNKHVSIEEKIVMFLTIIGHNERFVVIKRRFQHSLQTIHKYFHELFGAIIQFASIIPIDQILMFLVIIKKIRTF